MLLFALLLLGDGPYARFTHVATLVGHEGKVLCVDLDAQGRRAVSGTDLGELFVWDLTGPCEPAVLQRRGDAVTSVALTADGSRVVAVDVAGLVTHWSIETGRVMSTTAIAQLEGARLNPDGSYVTYGARQQTEVLAPADVPDRGLGWHPDLMVSIGYGEGGVVVGVHDGARNVHALELFDGEGRFEGEVVVGSFPLAVARAKGRWAFSDMDGGVIEGRDRWRSSEEPVRAMLYSPGGEVLACGDALGPIRFHQGRATLTTLVGHRGGVNDLSWRRDGLLLASASDDRTVMLWGPLETVQAARQALMRRDSRPPAPTMRRESKPPAPTARRGSRPPAPIRWSGTSARVGLRPG